MFKADEADQDEEEFVSAAPFKGKELMRTPIKPAENVVKVVSQAPIQEEDEEGEKDENDSVSPPKLVIRPESVERYPSFTPSPRAAMSKRTYARPRASSSLAK